MNTKEAVAGLEAVQQYGLLKTTGSHITLSRVIRFIEERKKRIEELSKPVYFVQMPGCVKMEYIPADEIYKEPDEPELSPLGKEALRNMKLQVEIQDLQRENTQLERRNRVQSGLIGDLRKEVAGAVEVKELQRERDVNLDMIIGHVKAIRGLL